MIKDLIDFFENASLEEVTMKLKQYDIEFVDNKIDRYDYMLEKPKIFVSSESYSAKINSKLTYKKLEKIRTDYRFESKDNLKNIYSSFEMGEAA